MVLIKNRLQFNCVLVKESCLLLLFFLNVLLASHVWGDFELVEDDYEIENLKVNTDPNFY